MKKRLFPTIILITYVAILIKVMVFKDVPLIRIGSLMLNFGGTDGGRPANVVPFKTILMYLLGANGSIIGGINLFGNIALLVPIGSLVPLVYRNMTWKKSLALAVAAGLVIEGMQVLLRVGIFDIDDVILNALGVMVGYGVYVILAEWIRTKNYKHMIIATVAVIVAMTALYRVVVYPITHQQVTIPSSSAEQSVRDVAVTGFAWQYEQDDSLNPDGLPQTDVFLVATYADGTRELTLIDTTPASCNDLPDRAQDSALDSTVAQCYAAGYGDRFKVTKGEHSYLVMHQVFEEGSPEYNPPEQSYKVVAEFQLMR